MLVIKQLLVPIDIQSIYFPTVEINGELFGSSKFYKIFYFVFNIRKKLIKVGTDMRMSKLWQFSFLCELFL